MRKLLENTQKAKDSYAIGINLVKKITFFRYTTSKLSQVYDRILWCGVKLDWRDWSWLAIFYKTEVENIPELNRLIFLYLNKGNLFNEATDQTLNLERTQKDHS